MIKAKELYKSKTMSIISVEKLSVNYGKIIALENVDLSIKKGDFIAITGPNGGGKSSLFKAILGLIKPAHGSIYKMPKLRLSYVEQMSSFDRSFPISVEEVLLSAHLPSGLKLFYRYDAECKKHAIELTKTLGLDALLKRGIDELSGGQLQRVLLARAMMSHPDVLLLDEPTAGVDEESRLEIYKLLEKLSKELSICLISHDKIEDLKGINRHILINKTVREIEIN